MPILLSVLPVSSQQGPVWVSLFDGMSLNDWKVGSNASTFSVNIEEIVVHGPTAHLFYMGPYQDHHFKNFELKVEVMPCPDPIQEFISTPNTGMGDGLPKGMRCR